MEPNGDQPPLLETLRMAHPRRRVDVLRQALRGGMLEDVSVDLDDWLAFYDDNDDPSLLVLLFEFFQRFADDRVVELARRQRRHRGDGVRLESIRLLLDQRPDEVKTLADEHRDDRSLEVQLLVTERLLVVDPESATDLFFDIFEAERDGPREGHALERGIEFLVEEAAAPGTLARLRSIQPDFDDPEGTIAWGIEQLKERS